MIIILFFFNIFNLQLIKSEECELPVGCESKEFPYHLCDYDKIVIVCTANPYNEYDNQTLLKPMKNTPCFEYDLTSFTIEYALEETLQEFPIIYDQIIGYDEITGQPIYGYKKEGEPIYYIGTNNEITGYNTNDPIYEPYLTYFTSWVRDFVNFEFKNLWNNNLFLLINFEEDSRKDTENSFNSALNEWTSQCENCDLNTTDLQNCCTKVIWTKDQNIFIERGANPERTAGLASQRMIPPSASPCMFDCNKSFIFINQSDIYTGQTVDDPGNYNKFYITDEYQKSGWVSLKAVLMHEMGHIFGFGHLGLESESPCGERQEDNISIMSRWNFENHDRGLSEDDKCMYMKMYCWEPPTSSVNDFSENELKVDIAPNPTSEEFNIYFILSETQYLSFEVFNNQGESIISLASKQFNKGNHYLNWNGIDKNGKQSYNGSYFLRITNGEKQTTKKLIITR